MKQNIQGGPASSKWAAAVLFIESANNLDSLIWLVCKENGKTEISFTLRSTDSVSMRSSNLKQVYVTSCKISLIGDSPKNEKSRI